MRNGDNFAGRVKTYISELQLLSAEGLHLIALSGGADSVALMSVLLDLGYRIEAVHCNFHLRDEESDRDESFVRNLCSERKVPLHLIHFDTEGYACLHHVSIEMAARQLRYRYFEQLRHDIGAESVCVAHHQNDAVETLLLNLMRGAGIRGLTGIRSKVGHVVRPLLCVSRNEIEAYLAETGQRYVIDSTNLEPEALRNKIRLLLIPEMEQLFPYASASLMKTAKYLSEAERVYSHAMDSQISSVVNESVDGKSQSAAIADILSLPSPECFLFEWLSAFGFNSSQTGQILSCLNGESGRMFQSHSHLLLIDRGVVCVESVQEVMEPMKIPETGLYHYGDNQNFRFELSPSVSLSKKADCVTLDAERVRFPLVIRHVQQADRFHPYGMNGTKLVSDFLTDCKLSLFDKRRQLVVTDCENQIVWLVGLRIDHRFRITAETTQMLCIEYMKST